MPAKSEAQRKIFGIAASIKEGKTPASYSPAAAKIAESEPLSVIHEFSRKTLSQRIKDYKNR